MDILSFISSIFASIVWPATLLIIILVFRKEFLLLLDRLSSLKYKEIEAKFDRGLREIEIQAREVHELPKVEKTKTSTIDKLSGKSLLELESPFVYSTGLVVNSWDILEDKINDIVTNIDGKDFPPYRNFSKMIHILKKSGLVSVEVISLIEGLRKLRNLVAHSSRPIVSLSSAKEYVAEIERIIAYLDSVKQKN